MKEESDLVNRVKPALIFDEGKVNEIYLDHLGHPTFGIGHLVTVSDPEFGLSVGTKISEERIDEAFESDIRQSIRDCHAVFGPRFDRFPSEVQEILVNMMFNLGRTRLAKFVRMRTALVSNDWKKAAAEGRDSLWYKQVTNRAERLMTRLENVS